MPAFPINSRRAPGSLASLVPAWAALMLIVGIAATPARADEIRIGEVRLLAQTTAPKGWMECNGRTLLINGNPALFSLLGTTFGGDGTFTFGLPNLKPIKLGRQELRYYIAVEGRYPAPA
jgi:hypothetical protein